MPDILYMSATPIPRTYALTIYGDMDISSIKTIPNGRKKIITYSKKTSDMPNILKMIKDELDLGHQAYVVAPLIEESDNIDLENVNKLKHNFDLVFGKLYKIGMLHGKMNTSEKEDIMNRFLKNEINILISTTVIEVGIDVKNATMMVIFDAERFGLSTIHQLRGRVGRNDLQSYCVLISNSEHERLKILTNTNDGFEISEADFKLRGQGDLFGIRQSGDMNFKIADLRKDFKILLQTKDDSMKFLEDNLLNDYPHIKDELRKSINLD
jgi:ATP-dependent DNA helicase RecG